MKRVSYGLAAIVIMLTVPACAGNKKPDVQVAGTTADVVAALTEFQHLVTQSTDSGALPVEKGKQLTTIVEAAVAKGKDVSSALKAYHAATAVDEQSKAATVQTLITELNGPVGQLLGVQFPGSIAADASKLIGNVMLAISAVQNELAKGLGAQPAGPGQ